MRLSPPGADYTALPDGAGRSGTIYVPGHALCCCRSLKQFRGARVLTVSQSVRTLPLRAFERHLFFQISNVSAPVSVITAFPFNRCRLRGFLLPRRGTSNLSAMLDVKYSWRSGIFDPAFRDRRRRQQVRMTRFSRVA